MDTTNDRQDMDISDVDCGDHCIGYCEKHDAYYWLANGEWIDLPCSDRQCQFCVGRPTNWRPEDD